MRGWVLMTDVQCSCDKPDGSGPGRSTVLLLIYTHIDCNLCRHRQMPIAKGQGAVKSAAKAFKLYSQNNAHRLRSSPQPAGAVGLTWHCQCAAPVHLHQLCVGLSGRDIRGIQCTCHDGHIISIHSLARRLKLPTILYRQTDGAQAMWTWMQGTISRALLPALMANAYWLSKRVLH